MPRRLQRWTRKRADPAYSPSAAEKAAAETTEVKGFTRRKPVRKPLPAHLPRERVVVPGPVTCMCCGSDKLSKIGEDITETLEVIPRQWKVIQTVREKFMRQVIRLRKIEKAERDEQETLLDLYRHPMGMDAAVATAD